MFNPKETEVSPQAPFIERLNRRWRITDSMAGVGLDPDLGKIPEFIWKQVGRKNNIAKGIVAFNRLVIEATHPFVCAYKLQKGFYQGSEGEKALEATVKLIRSTDPSILVIYDGKIGDIENTAVKYREYLFDELEVDALLINPYMGSSAVLPFAERPDKGVIVLCRTSNPEAEQIQGLRLDNGKQVWQVVLDRCANEWNTHQNIIACLSATFPQDLENIRRTIGDIPILLAGVGTQGGSLSTSLPHVLDSQGYGVIVSSSRSIIFAQPLPEETHAHAITRAVINLRANLRQSKHASQ
ncbi:MAG: orotidine 5'-phosphate decarboxylase [Candidatus Chisholmbacteria bacterium RIFCSPHIGHO2_01_FULL_48_12]|uniref:Orotidine-5'-phosphate decarboxylase n=1 Tax=Candidatus Chisholmbacteria bacterium RIFCSPHIGHO2_01_FULL_48_12 TaxID=1797589 RepID=A0A1G1VQ59_9BACT|nr:MAG: orotidine 5'-phosphate decarboxylase [Candidatus Chisholmbacteria bacterium RIFCSPHIGHO2_01_FULL_48_12]